MSGRWPDMDMDGPVPSGPMSRPVRVTTLLPRTASDLVSPFDYMSCAQADETVHSLILVLVTQSAVTKNGLIR